MAYEDSSTDILSKLGILDSNIKSPEDKLHPVVRETRQKQKPDFGHFDTDDNMKLLDQTGNFEHELENMKNVSTSCFGLHSVLFYGFLCCFAVSYGSFYMNSIELIDHEPNLSKLSSLSIGLLFGSFFAGYLFLRVRLISSFACAVFAGIIVAIVGIVNPGTFFTKICYFSMGFAVGIVERNIYLFVNENWSRNWRYRHSIAYFVIFCGFLIVALISNPVMHKDSVTVSPVLVVRHERDVSSEMNYTTAVHVTKPTFALGISENQDTKTAENAEKRKLAEIKKVEKESNILNCTLLVNATENLPVECQKSTITSTTTVVTTTTTTIEPTTKGIISEKLVSFPEGVLMGIDGLQRSLLPRSRNRLSKEMTEKEAIIKSKTQDDLKDYTLTLVVVNAAIFITFAVVSCFTDFSPIKNVFEPVIMDTFVEGSSNFAVKIAAFLCMFLIEFLSYGYFPLLPLFMNTAKTSHFGVFGIEICVLVPVFIMVLTIRFLGTLLISKSTPQLFAWFLLMMTTIGHGFVFSFDQTDSALLFSTVLIAVICILSCELYAFQQESFVCSPFLLSKHLSIAQSFGRIVGPIILSRVFYFHDIDSFFVFIQLGLIILCISFAMLHRSTLSAVRQSRILSFTNAISKGDLESVTVHNTTKTAEKSNGKYNRLNDKGGKTIVTDESDNCLLSEFSDVDDW
uniref:Uncharacterized protein n=1 Tax=Panagrolaimus sp. JU765 TaxID=591449 RepID=A0AC34QUQ4_9BILA